MSSSHIAYLDHRAVVRVSGADAGAFLQGLITNEMGLLEKQRALFAGLLSPQGKVLFEFLLAKAADGAFLLDVAYSSVEDLAKRLTLYKLRARVEIADVTSQLQPMALWGSGAHSMGETVGTESFVDPRRPLLGFCILAERRFSKDIASATTAGDAKPEDYHAHRISLGVPEGGKDYLFGELFPHEAMFDQLHGVSFTKGCYVGQEIVARMQHRGTARSRFLMVAAAGPLPERGTEVLAGDKPIGQMGSSVGGNGLALIRLDRLGDAYKEGKPITVGGVPITLAKPPYAKFEVPTP